MTARLTFEKIEVEAKKRGLQLNRINQNGCRYEVTETVVPGGDTSLCETLDEAWTEIYNWENSSARALRDPKFVCREADSLTDEQKERLVEKAREHVGSDELEIDEGETQFSRSDDNGYWVRAWVWLPDSAQE